MSIDIILPKLCFTMEVGSGWLTADSGAVVEGQLRHTIESDKLMQEMGAPVSGMLKIFEPVGEVRSASSVFGTNE